MRQTRIRFFGSIALIAALASTGLAQQQQTVAPSQQQVPVRPRGAGQQQPLRDAAKAAKQEAQQPRKLAGNQPKLTEQQQKKNTADTIVNRYVVGFQSNVGVTDEQARNLSDVLGKYVRRQLMLAQNRTEALKRLKELTAQNASEEEILAQNKIVESTETQLRNTDLRFYNEMNPQLSAQQQGKLRVYMTETAQDIHQAIKKSAQ